MVQLTKGAIRAIETSSDEKPVVQVIAVKQIQTKNKQNNQERYRLVISDGEFYQQAMLAVQQNHLITSGELAVHGVIRLLEHMCNPIQGRKYVP